MLLEDQINGYVNTKLDHYFIQQLEYKFITKAGKHLKKGVSKLIKTKKVKPSQRMILRKKQIYDEMGDQIKNLRKKREMITKMSDWGKIQQYNDKIKLLKKKRSQIKKQIKQAK